MGLYLAETTNELYRWFDLINTKFFKGELERPILTIQKTRSGTLGWFTTSPVWITADAKPDENGNYKQDESKYEINISAQALEITEFWTIEDLVSVLIHECVHYNNSRLGVKDCSGKIHNKKFKAAAEEVWLEVTKDKKVGWGLTSPTEKLRNWIRDEVKPDTSQLMYYRTVPINPTAEKKTSVIYHITCPQCNKTFDYKPKKKDKEKFNFVEDFGFLCKNCGEEMEIEEDEE